jgi:ankyrin repeat protein
MLMDTAFRGWSPLSCYLSCDKMGFYHRLRLLLEHGADPNAKSRHWDEYTPLAIAVRRDNQEIVEILLQSGAEINAAAHSSSKVTAIDTTAERHRIDGFVPSKPRRSG